MKDEYFDQLNYTLGNEDTALELAALHENAAHVVAVAGSGARVLPLLARSPRRVTCVDRSLVQLQLTELRIESARAFELDDYLAFWGYPPRLASADERRQLYNRVRTRPATASTCRRLFDAVQWGPLLYAGRWERTLQRCARLVRALLGRRADQLFECRTLDEQRRFIATRFPHRHWHLVLWLVGNARFFNAAFYKGRFPRKNISESHFEFYRSSFERLFRTSVARENWFLQLMMLGKLQYPEGNPIECHAGVYRLLRSSLGRTQIVYKLGDVVEICASERNVDFVSLSDVPSYLDPGVEQSHLQTMASGLAHRGRVVARSYLHVPEGVDRRHFASITEPFAPARAAEKTQMYQVELYEKRAHVPTVSRTNPPVPPHGTPQSGRRKRSCSDMES